MPFRLSGIPLLVLVFAILIGVPRMAGFYTDWLWFEEVGFRQVLVRSITAQAMTGLLTGLAAFAILWINLRIALRALRPREFMIATAQGPQVITIDPKKVRPLVSAAALLVALMVGMFGSSQWDTWLFFLHATPFGQLDPILGYDIGFYVFTLPLLEMLHGLAMTLLLLTLAAVVGAYVAAGNVSLDPARGLFVAGTARRHIAALVAVLFVVLAFGAWLHVPKLLFSPSGAIFGATYADVHARMPALWLLVGAAIVGAALAAWQATQVRLWPIATAVGLYLVVSVGSTVYAGVIQRFVVEPNEQVRETPFIRHNIQATREGFALHQVEERDLSGEARLTRDDLERNSATLRNVPLWNAQPLLDTFSQIQEIRTYYDFVSVDNDRYVIDGQYRQVMLSARELNTRSLPSRTWINDHLTFTHGYGITLGPVNEVTPEGLPVLFIRDLPPVSTHDLQVTQPAIYYGELPNDHVFVRTGTEEFDYPRGEANVFTTYEGDGGVTLSNVFRRLMFAIRFRSTDTFFSPNLTRESRVMIYRRIAERVRRIAPFLRYDPDPYIAIADGRLIWVQDAYTTTHRYPYSSPVSGLNYIRNSVKVTIDAYHGTTRFHLLDTEDPVAATMAKIFPSLFVAVDEMPGDLAERLRYPQFIFSLQAHMFATFHMESPAVFYNREDQWEIPVFETGGQSSRMEAYYTIMKLPGEAQEEFIQMLPYTPRQKDNLAAWLVARSDGENYGRLMVFQFPKQTLIFGPRQIAARISQDQVIAPQITLWNQQGSEVIQGTLLVIPIEESLIYIRPLYLRAAGGRIPELKRVIVAHQNQIVMEETLDQALDRLFPPDGEWRPRPAIVEPGPEGAPMPAAERPAPRPGEEAALAAQARQHYQRALQAQRDGNWALYGEEIRRLGDVLERLARMNP
jgi:uncharacterized protein